MSCFRTRHTCLFSRNEALQELDHLKFAFASMAEQFSKGTHEGEMARNSLIGIRHRIDYLHDSLTALLAR